MIHRTTLLIFEFGIESVLIYLYNLCCIYVNLTFKTILLPSIPLFIQYSLNTYKYLNMDCYRSIKSSSPSIKVSDSLFLLHQGVGLIIINEFIILRAKWLPMFFIWYFCRVNRMFYCMDSTDPSLSWMFTATFPLNLLLHNSLGR